MKDKYSKPESQVEDFKTVDVVTTSVENMPDWD